MSFMTFAEWERFGKDTEAAMSACTNQMRDYASSPRVRLFAEEFRNWLDMQRFYEINRQMANPKLDPRLFMEALNAIRQFVDGIIKEQENRTNG